MIKIVGKLSGRGVPLARLFLEAFQADRLQVALHTRIQSARRLGNLIEDPVEHLIRGNALDGGNTGE